jgi:signal transduction histidine kinase
MVCVTRRAGPPAGLAAFALGAALSAVILADTPGSFSLPDLLRLLGAWSFIGSGLVVYRRRPANRTGPLMVLVGLTFLLTGLAGTEQPTLRTAVALVQPIHLAVFTHVLLAFPTGHLDSRVARWVVVGLYLVLGIVYHAPLLLGDDGIRASFSDAVSAGGAAGLFLVASALLAERWRAGSRAWRRSVALVLWPGALTLAALAAFNASQVVPFSAGPAPMWIFRIAFVAMPFAFLAALLRSHLARASVAELVVALDESRPSGALRDALARTLGDPSLAVAYWLPDAGRYVNIEGQPVEPPDADGGRAVTIVEREGRRVAAIIHDETLSDEPELIRAAGAAAALALDNERLQAELRARLDELSASRARIVRAADLERRRIERNLHDGTQQRLTSIAMALGLAESQLRSDPEAASRNLRQAKTALAAALAELRELSQGIHPGILTERGIGPALEDLAYCSPLPVTVSCKLAGRPPEPVEAAAYYVVAEALANIAKHAHASSASISLTGESGRLVVGVRDDGIGGVDPDRGTGLRGLADRVQALGGSLTVESPRGRGTEVRVVLPCA